MANYKYSFFITLIMFIANLNAGVIHVSTGGSDDSGDGTVDNPYLTIQKGIDEAMDMDTVYVSNGIYEGGLEISNKAISLIGESREETKINQPISSPQVSVIDSDQGLTRIHNFRIKQGSSNDGGGIYSSGSIIEVKNVDFSNNYSYGHGAAINSIDSDVIVENSTFSSNTSANMGGAIFVDPLTTCEIYNSSFENNGALWGGAIATIGGGKLLVEGCNISFNTASGNNPNPNYDYPTFGGGGGIYQEWSDSLEIYNTQILNNTAANGAGGGIAIYLSNDIIIDNIVLNGNSTSGTEYPTGGGGVAFYRADNVLFENSTIANNVTNDNSGGGIFFGSESGQASIVVHGTFNRLTLVNNSAMSGGAIFCWSAILDLHHSTLAQNEASNSEWSGGGLASHYVTEPNIVNSLFYDNVPNSIHNGYQQTPVVVSYSLLQEEWSGDGNLIDMDPLFMDPDNEDFRLQQDSPCIDTGTLDLDDDGFDDNDLFYTGSAPDMGAVEWAIPAPSLQAYAQDSSVILAWSAIEEGLQYYQVDRATDIMFTENIVQTFVTTNTHTDVDIDTDVEYFYRVAGNVGYWTDYSNTVSVLIESLDLDEDSKILSDYKIHQNYPNPFNPVTTLSYELAKAGPVNIVIYDMNGRIVKNLLNKYQNAGLNSIKWDATSDQGKQVSAGMYIYSIETPGIKQSKKMLFIK